MRRYKPAIYRTDNNDPGAANMVWHPDGEWVHVSEVESMMDQDGDHMADLLTTITILAERIATLSNQKSHLESERAAKDGPR